ncbi:MAG: 1,6-anhydro-N-acetylmuramyl-L-alanine amidase AmpD [Burkholderiales bacterium]|nr:1,6-anhydro-N-acetylmuramyl-L-alanine amidase AmpD [Burkholderiales bacterium]
MAVSGSAWCGGGWCGGWWLGAARRPSPHHGARPRGARRGAVTLAVLHSISLPPGVFGGAAIEQLFAGRLDCDAHPYYARLRGLRVSAHFLVRRGGAVLQFVSVRRRAWHAGASSWRGRTDCNDYSVGIELEGLEGGCFEEAQYRALARLLRALARRCPQLREATGHEHVAPGRKHDPGAGFDWTGLQALLLRAGGSPAPPALQPGAAPPAGCGAPHERPRLRCKH